MCVLYLTAFYLYRTNFDLWPLIWVQLVLRREKYTTDKNRCDTVKFILFWGEYFCYQKKRKKMKYLSCDLGHLACYFMVYLFLRSLPQWFNAQFTRHYWNYFEKRLCEIPAMQICKRQSDRKVTLILAVKLKIADNNLRQLNCRDLLVNSNKIFYKLGLESISRQKASAYLA